MRDVELRSFLREIKSKSDAEVALAMTIIRLNQVAKLYGDENPITMKIYAIKECIIDYYEQEGFVVDRHNDSTWCVAASFSVHGLKFKLHRMFWGKRTPGRFSKRSLMVLSKGVRDWDEDKEKLIAVAIKLMDKLSIRRPLLQL